MYETQNLIANQIVFIEIYIAYHWRTWLTSLGAKTSAGKAMTHMYAIKVL